MDQPSSLQDRILQALSDYPGCLLEELVRVCPDLTWNQVFCEVDRLSRTGQVKLTMAGAGKYCVRLHSQAAQSIGNIPSAGQKSGHRRALHA